jgi:protein-tyrosine-phosphatase
MAVGLLRAGANVMGQTVQVASAGTMQGGHPAEPHAVEVMADRGIDISAHRSHKLAAVDIEAADLVL